jgi:hypothetical protein
MSSSLITSLLILWAVITGALAILLIYRALVSMKQEGQLFLDAGGAAFESEQRHIVLKLNRIAPIIKILSITSGALLIIAAAVWVYGGLAGTQQ